jgi:hypothetical protein
MSTGPCGCRNRRNRAGARREGGRVRRQRGLGHEDERLAPLQAIQDFGGGLPARKLAEIFLDVLDLERTGFEGVVLDEIVHG